MIERTARRGMTAGRKYSLRMLSNLAGVVAVIVPAVPSWAAADLDETINFHISSQPLDTALLEFSRQAHIQLAINAGSLRQIMAPTINGQKVAGAALTELLVDSGLGYGTVGHTVTVAPKTAEESAAEPASTNHSERSTSAGPVARISSDTGAGSSGKPPESGKPSPTEVPEVLVSAEKRSERLQDVPVPVTAISGAELAEQNQLRLQDYYTNVPGLTVTPRVQSSLILSIRGITTGPTNPTVGVTVDDVPYGASTSNGGGAVVPDIDPGDLARVEVLRGPQGTLYGANSMGGLLKFVTVDPSTSALSGSAQAGTSSVHNGAELGYNVRGSVNVPLSDTVAVRASGFTREDPGYIDNVETGQTGINETRVSGGRLSGLWRPADVVTLKLSALYQKTEGDGSNDVDKPLAGYTLPPLGDLQQSYVRGSGGYDRRIQAYSATLTAKIAGIDITSLSGYNINQFSDSFDASYQLGGATQAVFGVGGAPIFSDNKTDKVTQEIRLSASVGEYFDWQFGGFYTHEDSSYEQNVFAVVPTTGVVVAKAIDLSFPSTYKEYAAFADLTYHVTNQFDIQVGGRESKIKQTSSQSESIPLAGITSPIITPQANSDGNAFTYLVTPRFKISEDFMLYSRLASGYRPGGPNLSAGGIVPLQFNPDKTQNYEIGAKTELFDHRLSIDTSLYYIAWKDIQLSLINPQTGVGYFINGGRAKSQGVELSVQSRPLEGLTVSAWGVWDEAVLTENFPPNNAYGMAGDRLPYSSRFSANASVEQDFALPSNATGYVGAAVRYVGDRKGIFTATADRQDLSAYADADLRTGVKYQSWTLNIFLNNVLDRRGVVAGGIGDSPPFAFTYIQPRTVGASVSKTF